MLDCLQKFAKFVDCRYREPRWTFVHSTMWKAQRQCSFVVAQVYTHMQDETFRSPSHRWWFCFVGELNRSGQKLQPEELSVLENRTNGRRWIDHSAPFKYLWDCLPLVQDNLAALSRVNRNRWPSSWAHVVMVDSIYGVKPQGGGGTPL